jgi:hypothetical protein
VLFEWLRRVEETVKTGAARRTADVVVGFGVDDLRVPDHCARLHRDGRAPLVLFTGGFGSGSGGLTEPEAYVFKKRALARGVPEEAVLVEPCSTNTKQNALFSRELLRGRRPPVERAIVVAQPARQRRVHLTCLKHLHPLAIVNSPPPSSFEGETALFGDDALVVFLRGEIERILRYGAAGDIVPVDIPPAVMEAYRALDSSRV